ncbi:MAG: hypothetical protein C0506_07485 [Anaerolinea sp.]|nr:hypothetical protein [Anaerolinea sp.]
MTEQTKKSTRLSRIHTLLMQRGSLTVRELANDLERSPRTIQRDMLDLESELGVPLIYEGRRWSIMPGSSHPMSPVRLTLHESRAIYFALRVFSRTVNECEPDTIQALQKLADTLPPRLCMQIKRTVGELRGRPESGRRSDVLRAITEAWVRGQTVAMIHRSLSPARPRTLTFDPYLLEATQSGTYVIGFSHEHGEVRVFKLDRVEAVEPAGTTFDCPDVSDIADRLSQSWGGAVFGNDEQHAVCVEFTAAAAPRIRESYWHPSQQLEEVAGGGVRLKVLLPSLLEFTPWVRSWGPEARVIEPPALRDEVAASLRAAAERYA